MSANPKTPLVSGSRPPSHQQQGGPSRSNIDQVKQQVESVKDVMKENIDRAIDRGADIDALNARSQQLDDDARLFKTKSAAVRRRFCVSYYRTIFLIVIIVAAVLAIIIWWATK